MLSIKNFSKNQTLLHIAASNGQVDLINALLDRALELATDPKLYRSINFGTKILHYAVQSDNVDIVKLFIDLNPYLNY